MADTHKCITCQKTRTGRFTRRASGASGAFTKDSLPAWHCYSCLPLGQGRGEDEMAKTQKATVIDMGTVGVPVKSLLTDKRAGLALLPPLQLEVGALTAIEDADDYASADMLFGRIKQARKTWRLKMYGTAAKPGPIPSIRSGLDQLYELNREVDTPLSMLEDKVEGLMKAFKLKELREQVAAETKRQADAAEAQARIDALEAKKAALKTPAAQERVEQQIIEAAEELDGIQQEAEPETVQGQHSRTPAKKIPALIDETAFVKGIVEGTIPWDCITVNMVKVRAYFKEDPEAVAMFPGIEIQDDISIIGR